MAGNERLLEHEDRWPTAMGKWFPGERVVLRGRDLLNDLASMPWMGVLLYGITGRVHDEKQIRLFEGFWNISTSYPDPRLWNNRVAALAGTARSTVNLGVAAGVAVSEASIYGRRPDIRSMDFLIQTKAAVDAGEPLEAWIEARLRKYRVVHGYGRPLTRKDERVAPIMRLAEELGYADGPHVQLAFAIERVLIENRRRMYMNIAALLAALAADQGMSQQDYYAFMVLSFTGGMFPCAVDALQKEEGVLFPIRCDRIEYKGDAKRRRW